MVSPSATLSRKLSLPPELDLGPSRDRSKGPEYVVRHIFMMLALRVSDLVLEEPGKSTKIEA
jgi:hypothetical protein